MALTPDEALMHAAVWYMRSPTYNPFQGVCAHAGCHRPHPLLTGSIPAERLQNLLSRFHPMPGAAPRRRPGFDLYHAVFGGRRSRVWLRFLQRPDSPVIVFSHPATKGPYGWRVRLPEAVDCTGRCTPGTGRRTTRRRPSTGAGTSRSRRGRRVGPAAPIVTATETFLLDEARRGAAVPLSDFIARYPHSRCPHGSRLGPTLPGLRRFPSTGHPVAALPPRGDLVRLLARYPHRVAFCRDSYTISLPQ